MDASIALSQPREQSELPRPGYEVITTKYAMGIYSQ